MHLIEILLPLADNHGEPFDAQLYAQIRRELTERFGGLTAFSRAPAKGSWKDQGTTKQDDIIVLEVMADSLDKAWWRSYRKDLERRFKQDEIVVRASEVIRL